MSESASIRTLWREYADASAHSLKMWPESSRFDALPQCHPDNRSPFRAPLCAQNLSCFYASVTHDTGSYSGTFALEPCPGR
jgi:hypothetical protein